MMFNFWKFLLHLLHDTRGELSLTGGADSGGSAGDGGSDSGTPAADGGGDGTGTVDTPPAVGTEISFPEGLDDEIKADPSLQVFIKDNEINYANLIKSYVHAQKKMGEKGVKLPDAHSTDEDWNNFYNMLRPAELDKYELKNELPEGTALNEEMFTAFKENAHRLGLSTKQAQELFNWYNDSTINANTQMQEKQTAAYQEEVDGLKKEWGEGFGKEMNLAQRAVKEFADEQTIEYLKKTGLDGNVQLIRMFNKIGKGLLEDKFDSESHGTFGMTPSDAQVKINKIMGDQAHPYFDKKHPSHKDAVNEMNRLFEATMA